MKIYKTTMKDGNTSKVAYGLNLYHGQNKRVNYYLYLDLIKFYRICFIDFFELCLKLLTLALFFVKKPVDDIAFEPFSMH